MRLIKRFIYRLIIEVLVYGDRLISYIDCRCKYHYVINHPVLTHKPKIKGRKAPRSFIRALYRDRDKILAACEKADREDPEMRFAGRLSFGDPDSD